MATTTPSDAPSTTTSTTVAPKAPLPTLLPLEEDDEFEEFPSEDWDTKETYGATLTSGTSTSGAGGAAGQKQGGGLDTLWDDNWDDDDVADDFSVQLRGELLKQNQMQT